MSNTTNNLKQIIQTRLQGIESGITTACQAAGRSRSQVRLMAVSKTHSVDMVYAAYQAGLRDFGENYVPEGSDKIVALQQLIEQTDGNCDVKWHFIGPIQSNKTRLIAEHFDWVHSVDRLKVAQRLSDQRLNHLPALQVCIQVNISQETSKSGCTPDESILLASQIAQLPNLQLRGLMCIPAPVSTSADIGAQKRPFAQVSELFHHIKQQLPMEQALYFDTLSMGMSDDYPLAIAEGSTMIRIGSALFGERPRHLNTMRELKL